ncbi:hypothetical protein Zmor_008934, partial [Zophobas morio]
NSMDNAKMTPTTRDPPKGLCSINEEMQLMA